MADLRIGSEGGSGIERFHALREEALRRSRSAAAPGVLSPGKIPAADIPVSKPEADHRAVPLATRPHSTPDARSPLGRLIDLRA